jgi:hypothetical protein
MFQPKFPSYEELQEKWLDKNENLNEEEISALFGMLEAKNDKLNGIKMYLDSETMNNSTKLLMIKKFFND